MTPQGAPVHARPSVPPMTPEPNAPGMLSCSRIRSASIPIASQTFSKLNGHERSVHAT